MDKNIIIANSLFLHKYLTQCFNNSVKDSGNPIIISVSQNVLAVGNLSKSNMFVHSFSSNNFESEISYDELNRLIKILKLLQEQPITISFYEGLIILLDVII